MISIREETDEWVQSMNIWVENKGSMQAGGNTNSQDSKLRLDLAKSKTYGSSGVNWTGSRVKNGSKLLKSSSESSSGWYGVGICLSYNCNMINFP